MVPATVRFWPDPDRPDLAKLEGRFWPDQAGLVPGSAASTGIVVLIVGHGCFLRRELGKH